MRHPDLPGPPALVPESSLSRHKAQGWIRVSEAVDEKAMDQVDVGTYTTSTDLDAEREPKPTKPTQEK